MKKRNGFTLIELLAVIIILAIVALIATPLILDVIEDAEKSAAKSEAQMIAGGIETGCLTAKTQLQVDSSDASASAINAACNNSTADAAAFASLVKWGDATVSGTINMSNGTIVSMTVVNGDWSTVVTNGTAGDPTN